ncbi:MAG: hypothetical protein H6853_07795 [Rhodospirillales bacterium]|nr:hypothetical protein [Alphaproteobacteria bacterium]USO03421.1 MAG: hypothetical protein H6853_07795 [Rhodospirillales bacterium]
MKLSHIYNEAANRRKQSLPFVGEDRRKMIEMIEEAQNQEFMDKVLLEGIEYIQGLKRLA